MARNWRSSSKRRCEKLGRQVELPSIDDVHAYLVTLPLICEYCGAILGAAKKCRPNLDHRQPIARGGSAGLDNLALACGGCNRAKGEMTGQEFAELRNTVRSWEDGGKSLFTRLKLGFFR
jgi:5-methylcytosine-specific restriction endonuclease McrA